MFLDETGSNKGAHHKGKEKKVNGISSSAMVPEYTLNSTTESR